MNRRFALILAVGLTACAGCQRPDVVVESRPVKIVSEVEGRGRPVRKGEIVRVAYTAYLPDGTKVLSHDDYTFQVKTGSVIQGIDEAIIGMRTGGKRTFMCPPHLHWGRQGYADKIPPQTTLRFELALLDIES
jgi:FK506-binding protein 4/5